MQLFVVTVCSDNTRHLEVSKLRLTWALILFNGSVQMRGNFAKNRR